MKAVFPTIAALLVGVALLMLGNGPLGSLISLRLAGADADAVVIGLVVGAYFAGLTAGSLLAYGLIGRVGHIRAYAAFAAVLSTTCLLHGLVFDPLAWALFRFVAGYCAAGLFMCIESWFNARANNETRGGILALYTMTIYVAQGSGQFFLNFDAGGPQLFMFLSVLLTLGLVPVALTRMPPPILPDVQSLGFRRLYQISPLGMTGSLFSGLVLGTFYGLGPVFAERVGLPVDQISLFLSATILGGVFLQWPLGRLSDIFDRRRVLVGLFAALFVASLAMMIAAMEQPDLLIALALVYGGVSFALYPLCVAHTNDHMDSRDLVAASGGLVLAYSVGATVGPMMASAVMTGVGPAGLFLFSASVAAFAVAFGIWRMFARPSIPAADQAPFQLVPRTTPVAGPLDPRQVEDQLSLDLAPAPEIKP